MRLTWPLIAALPWILIPLVTVIRARRSRHLHEYSSSLPTQPPSLAVIIPARNEAANISRCLSSVRASTYSPLEIIVVDDHSTDGTGDIARAVSEGDWTVRIVSPPPLPEGWFGKQWACAHGASHTDAELLCFTDADTEHAPDLLTRSVNALIARGADLLSVAGRQEMHTLGERLVQPQIFSLLLARYGSTEAVVESSRASDKIANGQFMLFRREAYVSVGGHASVRTKVAEDLALAQSVYASGHRLDLLVAEPQLSTRMYSSLGDAVRGWSKNVYVAGVEAAPFGAIGRRLAPILQLAAPMAQLAPTIALLLAMAGLLSAGVLVWAAICVATLLVWWTAVYAGTRQPIWLALLYPAGAGILLWIFMNAIARGRHVEWKGRAYTAG